MTKDNIIRLFQHEFHSLLSKFRIEIIDIHAEQVDSTLLTSSSCCILHDGSKPLYVCKGLQTIYKLIVQSKEGSFEHQLAERIKNPNRVSALVIYALHDSDDHWVDALVSYMKQRLFGVEM